MTLRHEREVRPLEPKRKINSRLMELLTAKEILAEIFHASSREVDEMIQSRLEEQMPLTGDGLWPATFCLGE